MVSPKHLGLEEIVTFNVHFKGAQSVPFFLNRSEADKLALRAKREGVTVQQFIHKVVRDSAENPPPFWKR